MLTTLTRFDAVLDDLATRVHQLLVVRRFLAQLQVHRLHQLFGVSEVHHFATNTHTGHPCYRPHSRHTQPTPTEAWYDGGGGSGGGGSGGGGGGGGGGLGSSQRFSTKH